jgi:hypothetical protein
MTDWDLATIGEMVMQSNRSPAMQPALDFVSMNLSTFIFVLRNLPQGDLVPAVKNTGSMADLTCY